jgi:DNA-binding winged helix-turn-helix (wHTH) protein
MLTKETRGSSFSINGRFFVDPSSNLLKDKEKNKEVRLEPRIMEVLCLLTEKPGQTIKRDEIISAVWKDYGGGDEGLTQAISALRKYLSDDNRQLIQTISKKGYCFNGEITRTSNSRSKKYLAFAAIFILVALSSAIFILFGRNDKKQAGLLYTQIEFPGNNPGTPLSEQNETNTIITQGKDSTQYKLVMIGDRPPEFFINDSILPVHKWDDYMLLINKLKSELKNKDR